jgi:hypothetical protein
MVVKGRKHTEPVSSRCTQILPIARGSCVMQRIFKTAFTAMFKHPLEIHKRVVYD